MKAPAFQFYADDFIGGTCDLSQAEVGAYMRLLCYQWGRGEIPSDPDKLSRIAGGPVSSDVLAKFSAGKNLRMEAERKKQVEFRAERAKSGAKGASVRWNGSANGSAIREPLAKGMANDGSPSPSPSPSPVSKSVYVPPEEPSPRADSPKAATSREETKTDEAWIIGLEKKDCYRLLVIRDELGLAQEWSAANHRICNRRFFTNWLARSIEKIRTISTNGNRPNHQRTEADRDRDRTGLSSDTVGKHLKNL